MKKSRITIALMLIVALFTGLTAKADFGVGPIVGVNINKFSVDKNVFDSDNRAGFNIGATAEYVAPIIGLGVDLSLMYAWQQAEIEEMDFSHTVKSNFFQIPLHVKYRLSLPAVGHIVAPYIFTGPNVAFRLGGADDYFKTKNTQWGWDLGLGVKLINHLQIGAGYTFGINNIVNKTKFLENLPAIPTDNIKVKNNYWTITAAWLF